MPTPTTAVTIDFGEGTIISYVEADLVATLHAEISAHVATIEALTAEKTEIKARVVDLEGQVDVLTTQLADCTAQLPSE